MTHILHIETATRNCSVAIAQDGQLLVCREIAEEGYSHAEKLHVFIEETLAQANLTYNDLSAIAVSQGPGSYTGLRIGVSAAKGLCFALGIPLIAVDTLAVLASMVRVSDGLIVPMIDARRMEVYSAVFNAAHQKIREVQAEIITPDSFSDTEGKIHFVGDGQDKCKAVLTGDRFVFLEDIVYPSAKGMVAMAYDKYQKSDAVDVAYFEPYYLKDFMITAKK
jgi:tRNA threonylcarbamoyladenosine biosynthesis protein TsaB